MDKRKIIGKIFQRALFVFAALSYPVLATLPPSIRVPAWKTSLRKRLLELDAKYPGQLGLYVKDLSTGEEISFYGDEHWYLASGVKVPIAIEVFHQIDRGLISLSTKIKLGQDDYIDGAGATNFQPPGRLLSVRFLLEQMLIHSDNTASDLLIKLVGLHNVNDRLHKLLPGEFAPITTLADVRRCAYSGFHPNAAKLKNSDFIRLKKIKSEEAKIGELAKLLQVQTTGFLHAKLDDAYSAYYAQKLNSATLRTYGKLLELISHSKALSEKSTTQLITIMSRAETGKRRIKAGLPAHFVFAHKTGTQHARICDFGLAYESPNSSNKTAVAACARGFKNINAAEDALKQIGKAIAESGVLIGESFAYKQKHDETASASAVLNSL